MFSNDIVKSDQFLEMPDGPQNLYFHLGMECDDDGFVTPKKVMRQIGAPEDSLRLLIAKGFVIAFESGVVVIRHWREHNSIRHDRYNPTRYSEERSKLSLDKNTYHMVSSGNQVAPAWQPMVARRKEVSKEVRKKEKTFFKKKENAENANTDAALKRVGDFIRNDLGLTKRVKRV